MYGLAVSFLVLENHVMSPIVFSVLDIPQDQGRQGRIDADENYGPGASCSICISYGPAKQLSLYLHKRTKNKIKPTGNSRQRAYVAKLPTSY